METKQDGHIIVMLSNKGYVAVENNQIFQLWKRKCLKVIYTELQFRYPNYKISLASLKIIDFKNVVEVSKQFLKHEKQPKTLSILETSDNSKYQTVINLNKVLVTGISKMENQAEVKATVKPTVVGKARWYTAVGATYGVQAVTAPTHLVLQTGADILQAAANGVATTEGFLIKQLRVSSQTIAEIRGYREQRTRLYESILAMPVTIPIGIVKSSVASVKNIREMRKAMNAEPIPTV